MTEKMRALVKGNTGKGLQMESLAKPEPGPGEVLIKVNKVSICGTDMHIYQWDDWAAATVPVPMTIGHEFIGTVEACGRDVTVFTPGQRVSGEGHIVCKRCRNCRAGREHLCRETLGVGVNRSGAFADYLVIPEHNVYLIPDTLSDDLASILDPFGNAVHTALGFDLAGEDVLITGAGPIGLMAAAICRHVGARHIVVTDVNESRLPLALKLGASSAVTAGVENLRAEMKKLGMKEGFDVGLEMSGAVPALADMIETSNHGARIGLLGIFSQEQAAVALNRIIFKGIRLKGVYGREMFDTWHKGIAMLESGLDISPVITHQFAFEEYQQGFDVLESGDASKVVLNLV